MDRNSLKNRSFERRWKRLGQDLCNITTQTFQDGGASGDTVTASTVASDVKCIYEPPGNSSQVVVGGKAFAGSHRIVMSRTTVTSAITPEHRIAVQARGDKAEMIFEEPFIISRSLDPMVIVGATLVQQGYQE